MNRHATDHQIKRLIAGRILGQELSAEDNRLLDEWLATSAKHLALFRRVESLRETREILQLEADRYGDKMAQRFMQSGNNRKPLVRRLLQWGGSIAALVVLVIGIWLAIPDAQDLQSTQNIVAENTIVPGHTKAVLTLDGGQRVDVLRAESTSEGNVFIDVTGNHIVPAAKQETGWHTLTIPAGGEFQYTLADGSRIWLNSESELHFPSCFRGNERHIYLRGEAFFDIKKDSLQPFIVTLPQGDITVYGTRFVITSYADEPLSAVLVQGSIGFTATGGQSVCLKPEERLVYEGNHGNIRIEKVDTTLYTAWVDKMFIFRGQPLEEIMKTLARWYDLDITFADQELRDIRLSGRLNRYQDVRILLHTYEEIAGIRFHIDGRNIGISKK